MLYTGGGDKGLKWGHYGMAEPLIVAEDEGAEGLETGSIVARRLDSESRERRLLNFDVRS